MNGRVRPIARALLFATAVAVALAVLPLMVREYRQGAASESWQSTQGQVISSRLRSTGRSRVVDVAYAFKANGVERRGGRVRFFEPLALERKSTTIARYPTGKQVTVYYDRRNPDESALEPGRRVGAFLVALTLDLGLALLGAFAAVSAVREHRGAET